MKYYLLSLLLFPVVVLGQTVSPPVLSHESGFYTDEFYLTISHPDPDVTILYTLDGSEPKIENLTGKVWNYKKQYPTNPGDPVGDLLQDTIWTYEYDDSLIIINRSLLEDRYNKISTSYYINQSYLNSLNNLNIPPNKKFTILRTVAYKDNNYSNENINYYFISNSSHPYNLPIVLLNINPEDWYSYETGMNVPGIEFDEYRTIQPNTAINPWFPSNFRASGSSSEKKIHFVYIDNSQEKLNHFAGLRLQGTGSRYLPNRSIRLYAKNDYGASSFNYPFFANYNYNSFKRLILRNSGQDASRTMFHDAFIQQIVKKLNFDIQEYQPSILFINGEYHSIYNLRERFDDKYFERVYNVNGNQLDHLENLGEVSEGDDLHYNMIMGFAENNDLSDSVNFQKFTEFIDPINYTDYFITQIFINNRDWPTNNTEYWRKKTPYDSTAPSGHDGRWRWLLKDLDDSFGISWPDGGIEVDDLNRITTSSTNSDLNKATLFLRKLLENENYKIYFINRFADLMNTTFKPSRINQFIDNAMSVIEPEMGSFIQRWNPIGLSSNQYTVPNMTAWYENINKLRSFGNGRSIYVRNHIKTRFELEEEYNTTLDINSSEMGYIKINSIEINEGTDGIHEDIYPWTGIYFKSVPIKLTAIPKEGYVFTHWSGDTSSTLNEITVNLENNFYLKANFVVCPSELVNLAPLPNLCENNTPHLLVEGTPAGGRYTIGGVDVTSLDPSLGNQTIIYSYETQNGCIYSDTLTVIVNTIPTVNAGSDQSICETELVTLTGTGDAISYSWNNGVTNNTPFVPSVVSSEYIVTGTGINGCSNTDTITITVYSLPFVSAGEDKFICETEQITLTGTGDALSYLWNNNVTDNIPFIPSIVIGEYTVTGIDSNGCSNTDKVTVTVNPLPNVFISQTGDLLTASSGGTSYQWIDCETNTPITEATHRSFMVSESGIYAVVIGNQFGCNDTSACLHVNFVGIDELEVSNDIKIYPNPTSDKLFISFSTPVTEYLDFTIIDLQGKIIHHQNLNGNAQQYEVEVSHLVSGIYLVNIGNKYIRFVKN